MSDFLESFFAGAVTGFVFTGAVALAVLDAPTGGGLLAALSRAATALHIKMDSRVSRSRTTDYNAVSVRDYSLAKVFELLAVHLLPEAFLFTLLLKHGI